MSNDRDQPAGARPGFPIADELSSQTRHVPVGQYAEALAEGAAPPSIDDSPTDITDVPAAAPPARRWQSTMVMQVTPVSPGAQIPVDPALQAAMQASQGPQTSPMPQASPPAGAAIFDEWSMQLPESAPSPDWIANASETEVERSIEQLRRAQGLDHVLPPANQLLIEPAPDSQPTRLHSPQRPVAAYPVVEIGPVPAAGAPPQPALAQPMVAQPMPQPIIAQAPQQPMPEATAMSFGHTIPIGPSPVAATFNAPQQAPMPMVQVQQPLAQPQAQPQLPALPQPVPQTVRPPRQGTRAGWVLLGLFLCLALAGAAGFVAVRVFHVPLFPAR